MDWIDSVVGAGNVFECRDSTCFFGLRIASFLFPLSVFACIINHQHNVVLLCRNIDSFASRAQWSQRMVNGYALHILLIIT